MLQKYILVFAVDRGSDQPKDYKSDICCFFSKRAVLRGKIKYRFARNQVKYKTYIIISSSVSCSRHDIAEKLLIWR